MCNLKGIAKEINKALFQRAVLVIFVLQCHKPDAFSAEATRNILGRESEQTSEFPFSNTLGKGRVWDKVTYARPNLADIDQLAVWVFSVLLSLWHFKFPICGRE